MVYANITYIAEIETLLQKKVDEAVKWFRINKFSVNIDKCDVMLGLISGRNTSRYSLNIDIDGVKTPHIRNAKYLGVDSQLTWTNHINELSSDYPRGCIYYENLEKGTLQQFQLYLLCYMPILYRLLS